MKKAILPAICILLCTLFISLVPTEEDAAIYESTLRLHILAPSDSKEDQNLKLEIRDRILRKYAKNLSTCENSKEAQSLVCNQLDKIKEDCKKWLSELGYDYTVNVHLVKEWYDTREYSSFTLPAGIYTSLKIEIGEALGQNWWCVMYPPMCLEAAVEYEEFNPPFVSEEKTHEEIFSESENTSKYTHEEYKLITSSGYRVKFKLLEVASLIVDKK